MRPSHVFFAGAALLTAMGGVFLTAGAPEIIGWLVIVGALVVFITGTVFWQREGWKNDYDKRFIAHMTVVRAELEYAFRIWTKDQPNAPFAEWQDLCEEAEWALSYEEVLTKEGELLLEFAKLIYPEDGARVLRLASILRADRFDLFHDPARRQMAQYLEEAGVQMSRSSSFRKWTWRRLKDHKNLIHIIIFLAMPLKRRTTRGRSSDLRQTGFAYFAQAFHDGSDS